MKRVLLALLFAFFSVGLTAHAADDSLVGTYDGTLITATGFDVGIRIVISSVDADGKNIKGTVAHYGNVCTDALPIKGTIVGQDVSLTSQPAPDCKERKFELKRNGNKLVGKMRNFLGEFPINVSK